jgi:AhpD family alkylhydroperoxidase
MRIAPAPPFSVAGVVSRIAGRVQGRQPMQVFLAIGRQPALFRGWLHFAGRLMPGGKLPRRESELVILRVGLLRGNAYEVDQHRVIGRRAGLTEDQIRALEQGSAASTWSPRERAVLRAVEMLHVDQDLDDATWQELRRYLSEPETVELVLLAGHYEMLATFLHVLRVEPDPPR